MNGRVARKLRKVVMNLTLIQKGIIFALIMLTISCMVTVGNERIGGTIVEVTEDNNPVTARAKYKYMKEKYYNGAF